MMLAENGTNVLRISYADIIKIKAEYLVDTSSFMSPDETDVYVVSSDEIYDVLQAIRKKNAVNNMKLYLSEVLDLKNRELYAFYSPPLATGEERERLVANFNRNAQCRMDEDVDSVDFEPVVRLFNPTGAGTWLLTELDPEDNVAFGLCDLGMGLSEIGTVSLTEIRKYVGFGGLRIERDRAFEAKHTLSEYARIASNKSDSIT